MGRTSAPRRGVAVLSTAIRRWSRRGREVLLGKQDLPKSATDPSLSPEKQRRSCLTSSMSVRWFAGVRIKQEYDPKGLNNENLNRTDSDAC